MQIKKPLLSTAGLISALMIAAPMAANATQIWAENPSTQSFEQTKWEEDLVILQEFWSEFGVEEAIQAQLILNLEQGFMFESARRDSKPITTDVFESDGFEHTVETFSDGSILVSSMEIPSITSEGMTPMNVTSCTVNLITGGEEYIGCLVSKHDGVTQLSFQVSFLVNLLGYDSIYTTFNPAATCILGSCTTPVRTNFKANENSGGPAYAIYGTTYTVAGGWYSEDKKLVFRVGGNNYDSYWL